MKKYGRGSEREEKKKREERGREKRKKIKYESTETTHNGPLNGLIVISN